VTRKLTALFVGLNVFGIHLPLFGDEATKKLVEIIHTEQVNFAPGGIIRVLNSIGSLNVEGWDRPEVEITVIKSMEHYYEPKQQEQAARTLERVHIVAEPRSDSELTISTILPRRLFAHLLGGKRGLMVEYQIHAPRNSRLVIHHGRGHVLLSNVTGDVEATSSGGDILLMLPDSGTYSIDARSKLGTVSSDFAGASHRRHLVGSGFARATPPPSHRIYLRTGMGGITIKTVPMEAEATVAAHSR
jgi:hypothetical protein